MIQCSLIVPRLDALFQSEPSFPDIQIDALPIIPDLHGSGGARDSAGGDGVFVA
jgi:hypothetical protein